MWILSWEDGRGRNSGIGMKVHLGKLTWNIHITHLEGKMIFQTPMIMFHVNLPVCKSDWIEWIQLKPSETLVFHIPAQQVFWVLFFWGSKYILTLVFGSLRKTNEWMSKKWWALERVTLQRHFWYIYVRILGCTFFGSSCAIEDGRFLWIKVLKINAWAGGFFVLVLHVRFVRVSYCFSSIFCTRKWGKTWGWFQVIFNLMSISIKWVGSTTN